MLLRRGGTQGAIVEEFFEPTYTVDFTDESTRKRIRSAQPGDAIKVQVHLPNEPAAAAHDAVGTRSQDGGRLDVRLTIGDRFQKICYNYEDVLTLADERGKP